MKIISEDDETISAEHNGYRNIKTTHQRRWKFTKNNIELPGCPQKHKADMTLTYTKEGTSYIVFESHLFPNQSSIYFSHSNTLAFRSCAGCDLQQYTYVAKEIQKQGMDKELNALVVQQADYLDYLRYADVRAVFGERSKNVW